MRLLLVLVGVILLAGCSVKTGSQRLDFVGTTRFISSNRQGVGPADTLASRIYAEADAADQLLTPLRITVKYSPRRNPILYPVPVSTLVRDSIDHNPDPDFIYLDTLLAADPRFPAVNNTKAFVFTSVFGARTTSGIERWQYELRDAAGNVSASRAFQLSVRRADSLLTYQDYTLRLPSPAAGPAARRFLQLRAGLALPAYSVLNTQPSSPDVQAAQSAQQQITDLILLPNGSQLVAPSADTTQVAFKLNARRWPLANRRKTLIYLTGLPAASYDALTTNDAIVAAYNNAVLSGLNGNGTITPALAAGQVYAYRADYGSRQYGLIRVISTPNNTTAITTVGLQLQVRTAK